MAKTIILVQCSKKSRLPCEYHFPYRGRSLLSCFVSTGAQFRDFSVEATPCFARRSTLVLPLHLRGYRMHISFPEIGDPQFLPHPREVIKFGLLTPSLMCFEDLQPFDDLCFSFRCFDGCPR